MTIETESSLPPVDAPRALDQELPDQPRTLKPGEDELFKNIIEQPSTSHETVHVEVQEVNTGAQMVRVVRKMGDSALHS